MGALRWPPPAVGPAGLVLGVLGLSAGVALLVLGGEQIDPGRAFALLPLLVLPLLVMASGSLRRALLFGAFFFVAIDMSKAFYAEEGRFHSPGLYVPVAQMLLLAWGAMWAAGRLLVERRRLPVERLDLAATGFLMFVWAGALRSPAGALAYATAASFTLHVVGFYLVRHALAGRDDLRLVVRALFAGFVANALFAAVQMVLREGVTIPGIKFSVESTLSYGDVSAYRPVGLFIHPNTLADWVLWLLLPALALVLMGRERIARRVWWGALAVLLGGSAILLVTLSRGGWVAYGLGIMVLGGLYMVRGVLGPRHLVAAAILAIVAASAIVLVYPQAILRLTNPDGRSVESRILLTDQALMIIRQHPWAGIGYGAYNWVMFDYIPPSWANVQPDMHAGLRTIVVHNYYLLLASELGLPALLYFIVLYGALLRPLWPLRRWREPGLTALGLGLGAALVAHALYLSSDNYYTDIRVMTLWLAAGLLQVLARHQPVPAGEGRR